MDSNKIILEKLTRIETKLDEVITAMHEYDEDDYNKEYGESSFETFMDKQETSKRIEAKKNNNARSKTTK